ncbi:MAG: DUF4091 domain-containing protein [Clostridia bacterium]|nr:DUF4091 domain-containing protein [Clostridia bacterium]
MDNNIKLHILSSLEKIYHNDIIPTSDFSSFSMLRNEKKSFQVVVECDKDFDGKLTIDTPLEHNIYTVEYIKSDLPMSDNSDDYFRFSDDGYYPDLLISIYDIASFRKGYNIFWIEIVSSNEYVGINKINISLYDESNLILGDCVSVEIIDCDIDFNNFVYTNWFHTDCLASYYNIDVFSDEYWRITKNFLKTAADYGMNCVLTPLFTPPLDTEVGKERPTVQLVDVIVSNGKYSFNFEKLDYWIKMSKECGIQYFEMSHFFTQWGARNTPKIMATVDGVYKKIFGWETKANSKSYINFLKVFSVELKKYLEANDLKKYTFIHVSDEPSTSVIFNYSRASRLIHKLFDGYKIIDALSSPLFYKLKIVTSPVPANDHVEKFLGKSNDLWTYYCSGQNKKYVSNRFFCNDSIRTRIIGYQMYKFDIKGFLHWGYNFYYTQLSKSLVDPFVVSDAGGKFPSGDSYVVYPSKEGTPYHSIRLKVFYDALQDMAALNTLEKLTDKETCLSIIEQKGKKSLTFSEYPHSNEWMLSTREKINYTIKENLK